MKFNYTLLAALVIAVVTSKEVENTSASQTISQQCELDAKLESAKEKQEFETLLTSCQQAKDTLIAKDSTKTEELNKEWEEITKKIHDGEAKLTKKSKCKPKQRPNGTVAETCKLNEKLVAVKSTKDLDQIETDCGKAYSELLSTYPSRIDEFNKEWAEIQQKVQEGINKLASSDSASTENKESITSTENKESTTNNGNKESTTNTENKDTKDESTGTESNNGDQSKVKGEPKQDGPSGQDPNNPENNSKEPTPINDPSTSNQSDGNESQQDSKEDPTQKST